MSIATYDDLVSAIGNWLGRADLATRAPEFITLAEAKFNRALRCHQMEKRSTATVDTTSSEPEFIALPTSFHTMRRLRIKSVTGKPRLEFMSGAQGDEYRQSVANVTGQPQFFTVFGDELELIPTPDDAYVLEMVYRIVIPGLTSTNTTNWLLTLAPDAYLYGALMEAAPYMGDDERIAVWGAGLISAIDGLNKLSMDQTYGSGPLVMRGSGPTP